MVKVDINNMLDVHKKMGKSFDELLVMINNYKEMINDTIKVCDTPTSHDMRIVMNSYLEQCMVDSFKDFYYCMEKLSEIENIYQNVFSKIHDSVKGD